MMSKMKSDVMLGVDEQDDRVADLITDGCNMGIKSLHRYLNQYTAADDKVRKLARDVAEAEETLVKDLRAYL
jgi:lipoate synthase